MKMQQCEREAHDYRQAHPTALLPFLFICNQGSILMSWVDTTLSLVNIDGQNGFTMSEDIEDMHPEGNCIPLWMDPTYAD